MDHPEPCTACDSQVELRWNFPNEPAQSLINTAPEEESISWLSGKALSLGRMVLGRRSTPQPGIGNAIKMLGCGSFSSLTYGKN